MSLVTSFFFAHVNETFVVPNGVTSIAVRIVGASGGGTNVSGHPAGWGPLFDGVLAVTPGETLALQAGQSGGGSGGASNAGTGTAGYPDGGIGGLGPAFNRGGGGAGSSRIWRGGVGGSLVVLVSGGGGVMSRDQSPNPGTGNGGVPIGEATTGGPAATGNGQDGFPSTGGKGATPSSGGAGGTASVSGSPGGFMSGGNGAIGVGNGTGIGSTLSGGGGGGGYYGGGGGGLGGCGGGGSSFIDLAQGWTDTTWDTTLPTETFIVPLVGRNGLIRFTYDVPSGGGWSLGLRSILG